MSLLTFAQEETYHTIQDLEAWTSAEISYKPIKKVKITLQQQLRLKDDASNVDQYFTQFDLRYKLAKGLYITPAVRFIRDNDDQGKIQGYENHLRLQSDLIYKHDISRWSLHYRARYQTKQELQVEDDNINTFRLKVGTKYNIKNWKFDPKVGLEFFNRLGTENEWYKLRWTVGTKYSFKSAGDLGFYFRQEQDLVGAYEKTTNILFLKYGYTLKNKSK